MNVKRATFAGLGNYLNASTMQIHDPLHKREANTCTTTYIVVFSAEKRFKNMG